MRYCIVTLDTLWQHKRHCIVT